MEVQHSCATYGGAEAYSRQTLIQTYLDADDIDKFHEDSKTPLDNMVVVGSGLGGLISLLCSYSRGSGAWS
jgi:hypothetical protein